MEEDRFWDLVAQLNAGEQDELRLTDEELAGFADRWHAARDHAHYVPLREAVTAAFGHCGDDEFADLRGWLVLQGRATYDAILEEPDNLADFVAGAHDFALGEQVDAALTRALESRPETKDLMVYRPPGSLPRGTVTDPADLRKRYPRCVAIRDDYLTSSLPAVTVPLDPARPARTLTLGSSTWTPRRKD